MIQAIGQIYIYIYTYIRTYIMAFKMEKSVSLKETQYFIQLIPLSKKFQDISLGLSHRNKKIDNMDSLDGKIIHNGFVQYLSQIK